ncbi:prephenate dehydratase [Plesiomonas sp.]|uniref:prephenate dehydratase n=1 Tax=Plesiomonas sp. TaxID=2486279 RepID=UPI003F2AC8F8
MTQDLNGIRQHITQLDRSLLKLLAERKQLALEVARSKANTQTALRDTAREQELLATLIRYGEDLQLDAHYITQIYHTIIEDSVLTQQAYLQKQLNPETHQFTRVAFLGMRGSYSHLASRKYALRHQERIIDISCRTFAEILQCVEAGEADYGVLPIENTSSGSINDVYDLLQHTQLSIVGELTHPIEHCLLATHDVQSIEQIHTVYSHPQPIQQCSQFLATFGQVQLEFCESSSHAMQKVAQLQSPHVAAISSAEGGELYGLVSLKNGIANQQENISRFIVVARNPIDVAPQVQAKTTLIMSTAQQAGSLVEALLILRDHGINMTKLESRPINGHPWEEMFYLDIEGNVQDEQMQAAIASLTQQTRYLKVLGCYPTETVIPTQIT